MQFCIIFRQIIQIVTLYTLRDVYKKRNQTYIHDMVNTSKDNVVKYTINIRAFYTYLVVIYRTEWITCATVSPLSGIIIGGSNK